MGALSAPVAALPLGTQQPVHGRDRGKVAPVVQQPGPDLRGGQVAEPWFVQHAQDLLAFGRAERVRWARPRPGRRARAGSASPVVGRAWLAEQHTGPLGVDQRRQLGEGRLDHLLDRGSESALSESCSKSACAFPTISNAARVRASSASSRWLRRRTRSSSTCSGVRLRARPCPARPASAPASRARRHSTMWEVYRPSRRSNAPLSPGSVSRSYSARIASLYSGLNLRRRGRAGSWSAMSPSCDATTVVVILTVNLLLSRPERDKGLRQVSHVRLTDRADDRREQAGVCPCCRDEAARPACPDDPGVTRRQIELGPGGNRR